MRKFLTSSALIMSLVLTTGAANANPYDRALHPQQCGEIHAQTSGAVVGAVLLAGLIGGAVSTSVRKQRYNDCLARFGVLPGEAIPANRPVTNQNYGGKYGTGVVRTGHVNASVCPPRFYGMYRGTLYCQNGVLLR